MFFWNSLAFLMIEQMLAIWSLVPLPFLNPDCTCRSSQFTSYWSLAGRTLSNTLLAGEMSVIVWYFEHSLTLSFFGIGMKTDLFQSCGHCWVFQICWHIECKLNAKYKLNYSKNLGGALEIFSPNLVLSEMRKPQLQGAEMRLELKITQVRLELKLFSSYFGFKYLPM